MSKKENEKTFVEPLSACVFVCFPHSLSPYFCSLGYFFITSVCLSFSLTVRFFDCGRDGVVQLESSNPNDFRIEADGVIYAVRSFRHSTLSTLHLLITATDTTTQQQWVTQVWLMPSTSTGQQVNISKTHNVSDRFFDYLTDVAASECWDD